MQKPPQQGPKEGFGVQDVLFIVFKHKWKILLLTLAGFAAAAAVHFNREPFYQSKATIMVEYVISANTADPLQVSAAPAGGPGDTAMNTEITILKSEEVARSTAVAVGLDKLFPDGGATADDGAAKIRGFLEVVGTPLSNLLGVSWGCSDPRLSIEVLNELIEQYKARTIEIHRSAAALEDVARQTETLHRKLLNTEADLAKLRTEFSISGLADVYKDLDLRRSKVEQDLRDSLAQQAEQQARLGVLDGSGHDPVAIEGRDRKRPDAAAPIPAQVLGQYRALIDVLAILQKRDGELSLKYKPGNRLLAINSQQLRDYEAKRRDMIAEYPALIVEVAASERDPKNPVVDLTAERAKLESITKRAEFFKSDLESIKKQFAEQYKAGQQIDDLERQRRLEDENYRSMTLKLSQERLYTDLDPSRMPNLKTVENPTIPIRTYDKITRKIVLGLAGGGMALGFALAFIIELVFDRRVQRPADIQARLHLPLLLSIPYVRRKDRGQLLLEDNSDLPKLGNDSGNHLPAIAGSDDSERAIHKANHFILPYSETIRDRIIFNFEVNNIVHKPKLVAVAGLSAGAGSSTIASGLAKSFSEIRGAKVLLVDLSSHGEGHPAIGDVTRHSLHGALQLARNTTFKQNSQNLYYATATARRDDSGLTPFTPMHLYELMPHLQASDFDYIVFDMPTINQTSRTLTMAGLMDKVLLVLDAENTSRDALKWGYSELVKGRADVSCVFNKTRLHAPDWLIGKP